MIGVHLGADLGAIAAINKDAGLIVQNRTKPGGPGETGQPGQTFIIGGHIFALMHICARNQEAVNLLFLQVFL